jgi:hypothetical protein
MATLRELVTKLTFKVDRAALKLAAKLLDNVGKSAEEIKAKTEKAERSLKNIGNVAKGVGVAVAGLATIAVGLGVAFVQSSIQTAMAFEKMQAVLTTTEGSALKAEKAMAWVSNFAQRTPYELAEVTNAFVRMRAYGLDPTNGSLESLGNASAAMGKNVMDAVEMMSDAIVGEYERLKEFGIKGSKGKDGFSLFRFTDKKGVERTRRVLSSDRKAIEKAITDIFNEKYTGAMERLAGTLDGILSNLRDSWVRFQQLVMSGGSFEAIKKDLQDILNTINTMAEDGRLQAYAERVGRAFLIAYNVAKGAIKGVNDAARWIVDNRAAVEAALVGVSFFAAGLALQYGIATGAIKLFTAQVILNTRMIVLNTLAMLKSPWGWAALGVGLLVLALIKVEEKTKFFSKALNKALEAGKEMWKFFSNLKIPEIKIPVKFDMPKLPFGSFLSATHQMNADRRATTTPPAGRAPAPKGAGSGAGSKSFSATNTFNINAGNMNPASARRIGMNLGAGFANAGMRALEVHGV